MNAKDGGDAEEGLLQPLLQPGEIQDVETESGEGAVKPASFLDLFFFADKVRRIHGRKHPPLRSIFIKERQLLI